jgi:DNA-binding response OmpR family regulator
MFRKTVAGKRILVIEEDRLIQKLLEDVFKNVGALVYCASDGARGLQRFYTDHPDLIVLNVDLPEIDGWQVCQHIREKANTPILLLTAEKLDSNMLAQKLSENVTVITIPFGREEILRWAGGTHYSKTAFYQDDTLQIDLENGRVVLQEKPVHLSQTEHRLLQFLMQHAGKVLTYEQIVWWVWGGEYDPALVHVNISRLRKKIEPDPAHPRYLRLAYGLGYYFNPLT